MRVFVVRTVVEMERAVTGAAGIDGLVLRYGFWQVAVLCRG
jgi:hypothetical protein